MASSDITQAAARRRDPEMVELDEVIAQINDLFSGDQPDSSVRNVVTHIKDRLEESETLQQQAHNNTLAQFSASPDLQSEFVGAVIGAMKSHNDLSTQILNNTEISQRLMGELVARSLATAPTPVLALLAPRRPFGVWLGCCRSSKMTSVAHRK